MARVTVEECLKFVDNRFELVLIAAKRAHQLGSGSHKSLLKTGKDKPAVIALREIEAGLINASILTETFTLEGSPITQQETNDKTKMSEVEEELSETAIGTNDDISIIEPQ